MSLDTDFSSEDEVYVKYKAQRFSEMQKESRCLMEFYSEPELIRKSKRDTMVVHFYKPEFNKCQIMNQKLEDVSRCFSDIEFYKIDASICNLVTAKLDIKILPFLAFFKNGFFVDSLIGFEDLGKHWFETDDLVNLIKNSNIYK